MENEVRIGFYSSDKGENSVHIRLMTMDNNVGILDLCKLGKRP